MKISKVSFKASILEQMQKSVALAQPQQSGKQSPKSTTNKVDHFETDKTIKKPKKKRKFLKLLFGGLLLILIGLLIKGTRDASKLHKSYGDITFKIGL